MTMTGSESKQIVERYLNALSGHAKTPELVERFVSDRHLADHIRDVEAAFPQYELIPEGIVAERDVVAVRGQFKGVHRGTFAGIPATGRAVTAGLMIFYRLDGQRIAEHWMQFDGASLVAQLQEAAAISL
jgi:predicted ester cyclase